MARREEPLFEWPTGPGFVAQEAYEMASEIGKVPGWFAKQVPAWDRNGRIWPPVYYIRCFLYRKAVESGVFYIGSREDWTRAQAIVAKRQTEEGSP